MSGEALTREELAEYFRILLEKLNSECGRVGYTLAEMDVEYEGALSGGGGTPALLADRDGVRFKMSFRPVIKIKEGDAVG